MIDSDAVSFLMMKISLNIKAVITSNIKEIRQHYLEIFFSLLGYKPSSESMTSS